MTIEMPTIEFEKLVLICTKCANQFDQNEDREAPERLKRELKEITKEMCGKKVRVLTTSCLSLCPEKLLAIAIADSRSENVFEAYTLDPKITGKEVYDLVINHSSKKEF